MFINSNIGQICRKLEDREGGRIKEACLNSSEKSLFVAAYSIQELLVIRSMRPQEVLATVEIEKAINRKKFYIMNL